MQFVQYKNHYAYGMSPLFTKTNVCVCVCVCVCVWVGGGGVDGWMDVGACHKIDLLISFTF